jgi:hypothetical protein
MLINCPSTHDTIIKRAVLNQLGDITSTPHLKMKFPTKDGVSEVRGN